MQDLPKSPKTIIRVATALFFLVCVPLSVWETSVHSKIFVGQDPVATARNLLLHEFAFRGTIVSHFIGTLTFVTLVLLLYRVLSQVDKTLSRLMVAAITAQLAIVFVLEAINLAALMTLKTEPRLTFDVTQQQETAYLLMRVYRLGIGMNKIIFSLIFIPMGIIVLRSGIAPKVIGILFIIGGLGYVADTSMYVLLQRADYLNVQFIKFCSSGLYSIGLLWLLIRGLRPSANND